MMVFLATADALRHGAYTLSELRMAEEKWPSPAGRVIPVCLGEVPIQDLPPYLRAISVSMPVGDPVAEILAAISHADRTLRSWRVSIEPISGGLLAGLALGAIAALILPNIESSWLRWNALARVGAGFIASVCAGYASAHLADWSPERHAIMTTLLLTPA
jgi:hypothetical protein